MGSPTFWHSFVPWVLVTIISLLFTGMLLVNLYHKAQWRNLHTDTRGAANVIDFVLTFPILAFIVMLVIQFALIANASLVVHYSAYTAARSARVWLWDSDPFRVPGVPMRIAYKNILYKLNDLEGEVLPRVETAARFAVISISPASSKFSCANCIDQPLKNALHAMAEVSGHGDRSNTFIQKARYAFDPDNLRTNLTFGGELLKKEPSFFNDFIQLADAWPVNAKVEYRFHLVLPVGRVFGQLENGHYARWLEADVTLL